jgi:hypothetical protein
MAEEYVDGRANESMLEEAKNSAYGVHANTSAPGSGFANAVKGMSKRNWEAAKGATQAAMPFGTPDKAVWCCQIASDQTALAASASRQEETPSALAGEGNVAYEIERGAQAELLRCIFGSNPFPSLSPLDPVWVTPDVSALAHSAYVNVSTPEGLVDKVQLAVLADALEEAGCTDSDILSHCRQPRPHVRGCWVVDLILATQ